jgi:hypothetical protein
MAVSISQVFVSLLDADCDESGSTLRKFCHDFGFIWL